MTPASVERYAYWATGVRVTGAGFLPGEPVVLTDTAPSGLRLVFETVPADDTGHLEHVYKTEVNGAPVGLHRLLATGIGSGRTATTSLRVTVNALETSRVTTAPTSITQDQFIRTPVNLTATGFAPHERLFVNLFGPDASGQAVEADQALFADATGTFRYPLLSTSAAVPVGEWQISVIGSSGHYGGAVYQVTPGAPRVTQGKLTVTPSTISSSRLATTPLSWQIRGLTPFDAFDLTLSGPLGATTNVGTFRADGQGGHRDVLRANGSVSLGSYRMTAISRTTGNTTTSRFVVTDDEGRYPPNASLVVSPSRLTAAQASADGGGFVVTVTNAPPGSFLSVSVTAPDLHFPALRDGRSPQGSTALYTTLGVDGTAVQRVAFVRPQPAGRYLVDVYFQGGHLSTPIVVTR